MAFAHGVKQPPTGESNLSGAGLIEQPISPPQIFDSNPKPPQLQNFISEKDGLLQPEDVAEDEIIDPQDDIDDEIVDSMVAKLGFNRS